MARIDNGIDVSPTQKEQVLKINEFNETEASILTKSLAPAKTFLIVFGLVLVGFFVGQFVASIFIFIFLLLNGSGLEVMNDPNLLYGSLSQSQLLISQSFYTLVFTFLVPWFYMKIIARKPLKSLFDEFKITPLPLLVTLLATLAFMFVNGYLVEWNANVDLPDFMSGFEKIAREFEDSLAETTKYFTTFNNFGAFILAFIVVAILPGIGEELLFRGLLQNAVHRWSKNAHVAIWASAFLFSAIHLQFYGLVPRMALGALFGYLYVWSGNLWYPILAHMLNNGLSLVLAYMYQLEATDINPDEGEVLTPTETLGAFAICLALLFLFRNYYLKRKSAL